MYCCARYSEDNAWYRAQVMDIDLTQQTATVCFVDHGNTDVVNLASDLRQLSADLLASPCQAVPCSLACGPWSSEQCSSFETATMDKPLQATFNEFLDNTWLVTLQDGDVSLNDLLTRRQEKPCVGKPSISIGDEPAVYIINVNSADDVVLQLNSYMENLDALMADIASSSLEGSLPITDQELGSYCLAKFTEDEAWYRAKVSTKLHDYIFFIFHCSWFSLLKFPDLSSNCLKFVPLIFIALKVVDDNICGIVGKS